MCGYSITPHFLPIAMSRSKSWMFTINNPRNNDIPRRWKEYTYCIWQLEQGTQETPHLQGYIVFSVQKRLSTLKKIDNTAHWEIRRGTHKQAKEYCSKEDTRKAGPWILGIDSDIPDTQGTRTDLNEVKKAIDEGKDEAYLADNYFQACAKHMRWFRDYKRIKASQREWKTHVKVLWGPTGTGKSMYCAHSYPEAYWKPQSTWWDGYTGQEVVIIDEFYGWLTYSFMLRLLDRYPLVLETKGGHTTFLAKTLIITSNKHPRDWYDPARHAYAPLERRLDEIIQYPLDDSPSAPPIVQPSENNNQQGGVYPPPAARDYSSQTRYTTNLNHNHNNLVCDEKLAEKPDTTEWDTDSDEEPLLSIARLEKQKSVSRLDPLHTHVWQSPAVTPSPELPKTRYSLTEIQAMYEEADRDRLQQYEGHWMTYPAKFADNNQK